VVGHELDVLAQHRVAGNLGASAEVDAHVGAEAEQHVIRMAWHALAASIDQRIDDRTDEVVIPELMPEPPAAS